MAKKYTLTMQDFAGKKVNMHTHTARCMHAKGEDREYVEKAIEAGYEVLGFSDHIPWIFEDYISPIRMEMKELENYVASVENLKKEYQNDIKIYLGLETEYFPNRFEKTMEKVEQYPIEFMLLGQHFYDDEIGWFSVRTPQDEEVYLETFVNRVMTALETERFLYVAHAEIINFTGKTSIYKKHMFRLAEELKRRNMPIEINVNGFRKQYNYPNTDFIEIGVENGNEFIVAVDAHSPEELLDFDNYEKCRQLVLERGGKINY